MNRFAALSLFALARQQSAAPLQHDLLAIDEGLSNLLHANEANPKLNWLVHLGREQTRDLQLEGGGGGGTAS